MSNTEKNTEQQTTPKSELAERLSTAHVSLRPDLEIHRHLFHGVAQYVIRDPLTLKCCKLNHKDYTILTYITRDYALAEIFERLVAEGVMKPEEENGFYRYVVSLHQMALLNLPISNDKTLYKKFRARMTARKQEKLMSFFFLRVPLFDPDKFLTKYMSLVSWLFTKTFFMVWLMLMTIGGYIIAARYEDLMGSLTQMFDAKNVVFMWFILIVLKVFHELGHGFACKKFGGQVTEMGVFFIVMTPCAYVDVTSSWGFNRKINRLIVGLGGVYFESLIAVIALIVWSLSDGTTTQQLAHDVFFLASFATVLMNINPLMRFDGYYILSDYLEIPNLRQESQQYATNILKRITLGIPVKSNHSGWKIKSILFTFGIASSLYRSTVILSISIMIAMKAFIVGLGLAAFYIISQLYKILKRMTVYMWTAQESASVRGRAIVLNILILAVMPIALFTIPIPGELKATGQITCEKESVIHSLENGFITSISVKRGQQIASGSPMITLDNKEIENNLIELSTRSNKAKLELASASYQVNDPVLAEQQNAYFKAVNSELELCKMEYKNLVIAPNETGTVVACMDEKEIGSYVKKGTPVATIISGKWVIKLLISEQEMAGTDICLGQQASFRAAACPGNTFYGNIVSISPQGQREIEIPALTSLGQGNIAVNNEGKEMTTPHYLITIMLDDNNNNVFRYGMTGTVKLGTYARPAGIELVHKIQRFINSLNKE